MKRAIAFGLCLLALEASAQTSFYQCKDKWGQPVFSERPCGEDAKAGSVNSLPTTGSVAPADSSAMTATRQVLERERDIEYLEDRIDRYESERSQRLRALENRARYANNNLAGAQFRESLATEMQSVNAEYSAKIDSDEKKIATYRDELDRLQSNMAEAGLENSH